jgi:hypothetical protein
LPGSKCQAWQGSSGEEKRREVQNGKKKGDKLDIGRI